MPDSDATPQTLAALHARRRRAPQKTEADSSESQMGLLFAPPSSEETPEKETRKKPARERKVWTVRGLVAHLRGHVEKDYADEWVEGEISNYRAASSGHIYFTLKDGDAQLPVVLFRRQAILLRFRPEDGLSVLVRGSVSVYESRGQLQLIAETMEPRGEGALRLAYEQLRQKLLAEGLFDAERKRPLPPFPQTIGIVTSPSGAVLRDIANICKRRHACLNLLVYPALMQGSNSAEEVRAAIAYFNSPAAPRVEIILLARGGGSAEDLWGFNDETLARAIAASEIPIVSAIGHETDFTIADFVADLRAPTPSAAAELITEHQHRVEERVTLLNHRLLRAVRYQQMHARQRLAHIDAGSALALVQDGIQRRQQHLDALRFRMESALYGKLKSATARLARANQRLGLRDASRHIATSRIRWNGLDQRLHRALNKPLENLRARQRTAEARLRAMDPNAVLRRGYALVFDAGGKLVRDASYVQQGEEIIARLAKGEVQARVTGKKDGVKNA